MKKFFSLFFTIIMLLCASLPMRADFAVTSITFSANDLDASTYFPEMDNYRRQCALIKVQVDPPQGGFSFETGSLGVVKVVEKLPEIWVYVPEKTMKIKIMHPKLGVISNSQNNDGYYWFHDKVGKLESGKVYVLKLALNKRVIEEIVEVKKESGFLILTSVPSGAEVWLGKEGETLQWCGVTPFQKNMEYGRYIFRLKKTKYHDEPGIADVKQKRVQFDDINLRPAFGSVYVTSTPSGAAVTLDGENTGKVTPCTLEEVKSGEHEIRLFMDNYSPVVQTVAVTDGQTTPFDISLAARFARVTISTLPGVSIKVNGVAKGVGQYIDNLMEGLYDVEVSLASHRPESRQIEVVAGVPQTVELNPTPIYGSLEIITTPMDATITIKGKNYGITPIVIDSLLVGEYDVVLSKAGCATVTEHVTIGENLTSAINTSLPSGRAITIATDKSGDEIFVDGKRVGVTPLTTELSFGTHEISAQRGTKRTSKNVTVSHGDGAVAVRLGFDTGVFGLDGTFIVNEQFSSNSSLWKKDKGNLSFVNGKCVFQDLDNHGYSELTYKLPKNLKNEDFQVDFRLQATFNKSFSTLFFILGTSWDNAYRFGFCDYDDGSLMLRFGDFKKSDKYFITSSEGFNLPPNEAHQYTIIKKGKMVEWYADGKLLFSKKIKLSDNMTVMGFLVPGRHIIEVDYITIKLL